jgi:broad specificity polyphosphatase/5'/3'-nucleotidase SurE
MHKSWSCTKSSTSRSGRKQGIAKSVRGALQENRTKNDRRATTAWSINIDAIVKEENTTSVNTTTNHRIERERVREITFVREREFVREYS